jgi:hypothetical protein
MSEVRGEVHIFNTYLETFENWAQLGNCFALKIATTEPIAFNVSGRSSIWIIKKSSPGAVHW